MIGSKKNRLTKVTNVCLFFIIVIIKQLTEKEPPGVKIDHKDKLVQKITMPNEEDEHIEIFEWRFSLVTPKWVGLLFIAFFMI